MKNNQEKPSRGGARPGAGRKAGSPNKATAELKDLAREYTGEALLALLDVMRTTQSDRARVAAVKEVFDRGYGRAPQSVDVKAAFDLSPEMKRWLGIG